MVYHSVNIPADRLANLCRRYGVKRLSLFGSILTEHFGPQSDVDMLVEFLPTTRIGFFGVTRMELELTELVGRKVDLRTPQDLSKYFRDRVVSEAQLQYAA